MVNTIYLNRSKDFCRTYQVFWFPQDLNVIKLVINIWNYRSNFVNIVIYLQENIKLHEKICKIWEKKSNIILNNEKSSKTSLNI